MRKKIFTFVVIFTVIGLTISCAKKPPLTYNYNDGVFQGESQSIYTENYWGVSSVTISGNKFIAVDFHIEDRNLDELFDEDYWQHYIGNEVYISQCNANWQGVLSYPPKFLVRQNINKVDAISGATWSYNLFRASVGEALKQAEVTTP